MQNSCDSRHWIPNNAFVYNIRFTEVLTPVKFFCQTYIRFKLWYYILDSSLSPVIVYNLKAFNQFIRKATTADLILFWTFLWSFYYMIKLIVHNCTWNIVEILLSYCWDIVEILLRYCWDIVEILLRYCWDIVEILLRYCDCEQCG